LPEKHQRKPQNTVGHAKETDKILNDIKELKRRVKNMKIPGR
jgi:iron uptake system EfeUOB component EfeO/EfeM